MISPNNRIIFHVDMDAFFTSIEQRDNPYLYGKPVIVGALPGNRGVVSAASYEARKFGIHSAMPINQAYSRCPKGEYLRPRMDVYKEESAKLMKIFRFFTPEIEQISIDEAFMDMTGTERLWGSPDGTAEKLSRKIQTDLNLTASIGIAPNKFLAKLASDMDKPKGITKVPFDPEEIVVWLAPLSISVIWGVGIKTTKALNKLGVRRICDLQKYPVDFLKKCFGKQGKSLFDLCRGIDTREIENPDLNKSISREYTFKNDTNNPELWKSTLLSLSRDVAHKTRMYHLKGHTVFLIFRTPDFQKHSRRTSLNKPTDLAKEIYETACVLLDREKSSIKSLRLIGVGVTNFNDTQQLSLFDSPGNINAWEASEKAIDTISERFGKDAVFRGGEIQKENKK